MTLFIDMLRCKCGTYFLPKDRETTCGACSKSTPKQEPEPRGSQIDIKV